MNHDVRKRSASACFRRWANKAYAIFNSLHRCVKIGVLCVGYTMLVSSERSFAQADSTQVKKIDLEAVEVSADAVPGVFAPVGRTITQVRKSDIDRAAVQSLADMLELIPSVDLRQRGPYGAQADVSIRGSSFDQTLILLNGINISDPQTGHYSLNLPIDLESVEKIEVLEGPAARIFGNNALGGAVNFITGMQPENYLKASLAGGQYGFYKAALSATAHTCRTTHHLAVSQTASDGYMHNTDFKNLSIFSQNKWNSRVVPMDLQLGYTQKDFGANSFYGPKYPDQYESLHTFFAALKSEVTAGRFSITPSVYWRRNYDRYILNRNRPDDYRNFHYTGTYGADVTVSLAGRFGRTSAGMLARSERIYSNNLGEPMETPRKVPRQDDKWYTKTGQRTNISAFAEQSLHIGKWSAALGVLVNHNSYTGNKPNVYPGIDLAFRPNRTFKIYASVNRAMRLPTFTDLYYQSPMNIGNPGLEPERSTEYELGARIATGCWTVNAGYFYRNISDAIDWIWLDDRQKWHTMNLTDLYMHGVSTGGQWDVKRAAGENFPLQSLTAYYTFMSGNKSSSRYKSGYVMDYLRHRLNFGLTHRIAERVYARWMIGWQDRNGTYMQYHAEDGSESEAPYDPFWQIDLRIYRHTGRLNVFAEASNLGGGKHQDIGNIILPGRWIRAGIAVTLKNRDR
ncbi:MAG: TonB-dependent receptor [Bacteroidales bacterium]|jgi:iron complex outermembrane receptor protein|nr:TonB-dependent receptor [Bacteroidales bacterium]